MDDLQEELTSSGVEDKDGTVDGFCCQITLESLVNCNTVDVGVIHKPYDLVTEQLSVVLGAQVRFSRLTRVQLEALPDSFTEDIQSRVSFHYLCHGLLDERLDSREPIPKSTKQVVCQVNANEEARWGGVDGHVICCVIEELSTCISLHVMGIVVAPPEKMEGKC